MFSVPINVSKSKRIFLKLITRQTAARKRGARRPRYRPPIDMNHPVSSHCTLICGHRALSQTSTAISLLGLLAYTASVGVRRTDKSTQSGHFSSSVALYVGRPAPLRNGDAEASASGRRGWFARNRCSCVMIPTRASSTDNNLITTETSYVRPAEPTPRDRSASYAIRLQLC